QSSRRRRELDGGGFLGTNAEVVVTKGVDDVGMRTRWRPETWDSIGGHYCHLKTLGMNGSEAPTTTREACWRPRIERGRKRVICHLFRVLLLVI
ncbi:hypothetical protein LINPERPRIM_LOCUS42776, partial [Linum perenne]